MPLDPAAATLRPLRADARRNREAILRAALEMFESEGALASLDAIALRAGTGNATLYRNFPTREALLAAVMESGIANASAEAEALASAHSPRDALAEWLVSLAWRLRIWHDLPHCVASASAASDLSTSPAIACLVGRTRDLLERAQQAGAASGTIDALETFQLVTALSWAIDRFGDDAATARRRVERAMAGILDPSPKSRRSQR